jgi:3-methyladenine DNA glycosylase/8-oxoguanine DNA glycosylase
MPTCSVVVRGPLDLARTLAPLARGPGDRTARTAPGRAWLALRTADGDAVTAMAQEGTTLRCEAWGPGADALLERLDDLIGAGPEPGSLAGGPYPLIRDLARRYPGVRIPRTRAVMASLVPAILEQKVTGTEARRAWFGLIRDHGTAAPGPPDLRLRLPPPDAALAGLPYFAYHPYGVERRRADLIRRVAARGPWFDAAADLSLADAQARLTGLPGLGPWTAAEVAVRALGDPDAVSVGDFHLKNLVSWALAGEPRGTDERMLELLAPYAGQRAHVVRLLELSGLRPPSYGPRLTPRRIEAD